MQWSQIFGSQRMTWLLKYSQLYDADIPQLSKKILCTTNLTCTDDEYLHSMWVVLEKFDRYSGINYIKKNEPQLFELNFVCNIFMGNNYVLYSKNKKVDVSCSNEVFQIILQLLNLLVPVNKSNLEFTLYQNTIDYCQDIINRTYNDLQIKVCVFLMERIIEEVDRCPFKTIYYNKFSNVDENKVSSVDSRNQLILLMKNKNNYKNNNSLIIKSSTPSL